MKSTSVKVIICISILLVLGFGYYWYGMPRTPSMNANEFKAVEGKMTLTDAQKNDVPKATGKGILVNREQDEAHIYQATLGDSATPGALLIGELDSSPSKEINVPVYSCLFQADQKPNHSLDVNQNCSAEGKLESSHPVGYLSKDIRVGFRMLIRCRSPQYGLYLSLNSHCESPKDRADIILGSIRSEVAP
jgi:hypothetical protein